MAKLTFFYGTMNAGKTVHLLKTAHSYEERGLDIYVVKPRTDTKAGTKIKTRMGMERETNFVFTEDTNFIAEGVQYYTEVEHLFIDEAQFLTPQQVDELSWLASVWGVNVYAYGLRLNVKQTDEGFKGATRLLQVADELVEIEGVCECGEKATRNIRYIDGQIDTSGPAILIDDGGTDVRYDALCSTCWEKKTSLL